MSELTSAGRPTEPVRARVRAITPARLLVGRAGTSYPTHVSLRLRGDHAAARDAVAARLDRAAVDAVDPDAVWVATQAGDHATHLLRPDLGRRLSADAVAVLGESCPHGPDLQLVVGDGLSATAVHAQLPLLLPALKSAAADLGWTVGRTVVVEFARVGVLNDIGAALGAQVVALLVGERPGLNTAESLSAYLAYRPVPGDTDARRNLVSNIHADGLPAARAAGEIIALAGRMMRAAASGVALIGADGRPAQDALAEHDPAEDDPSATGPAQDGGSPLAAR